MDSFNVLDTLGDGTFGTVYLCERKHNLAKVVVKKINIELKDEQMQSARNEAHVLKSLYHPNVIQHYSSFPVKQSFFIVMEYAANGNLHDFIKGRQTNYLPQELILNYFGQILNGLNHIHSKNVIHRDLKCENIFIAGEKADVIKIGDFGISKIVEGNNKTQTVIGTTNYVAPEICHGRPYDKKSDIWSLGCVLYELCAMERMFDGPAAHIISSISSGRKKMIDLRLYDGNLQYMIDVMLQLNPTNRPDTAGVMKFPILFPYVFLAGANLGCIHNVQDRV